MNGQLRDAVTGIIKVHKSQMGHFIGKRGANIRATERQLGVSLWKLGEDLHPSFVVYAPTEPALSAAVAKLAPMSAAAHRDDFY
jgi:hypothetical protein